MYGTFLITVLSAAAVIADDRRPIYSIGHMVNSIQEITKFLSMGANVLESDVEFFENGTVNRIHHGFPCDFGRFCDSEVKLRDYLDHLRKVADPKTEDNYHDQLIMQYFDMKLDQVKDKTRAGSEMADAVLDHLWKNATGLDRIKVLLFIYSVDQKDTFVGFVNRFKNRGVENLLKYVAFDGGLGDIGATRKMFENLGIKSGIWMGDGATNWYSFVYPDGRLKNEIRERDSPNGFIDKVYHWTIDSRWRIRKDLDLGVDGFISNRPDLIRGILAEETYSSKARLATTLDDPFFKFKWWRSVN